MQIRSERREAFLVPPEEVWAAMGRVDAFQRWWPWLHRFEATGLVAGDTWTCEVRPPVPYSLTFTVTLDEVVPAERVRATIAGDVEGRAELALRAVEGPGPTQGCEVAFSSWLGPGNPLLRVVAVIAGPVARFGHDWVLDIGGRQFRERALAPELA